MTVGEWSSTVSFEAKMDPRVVKEGITDSDVTAQLELALKARDGLSNARLAAARLEKALEGKSGAEAEALTEIQKLLVTAPRRYSQPMLIDMFSYLYQNLNRADQRPGKDAYDRYEELTSQLEGHVDKLEQLLETTNE
jgi:hypothetical protein